MACFQVFLRSVVVFGFALLSLTVGASASAPPEKDGGGSRLTERTDLSSLIERYSRLEGVDPRLIDALIRTESGYNPKAVSKKGAMGLMQLMPQTARRLQVDDPFDPEQNIRGGVKEVSRLIERYSGNIGLALAAYNAGEGAVARYRGIPPFRETRNYVGRIMELYTGRPYSMGRYRVRKAPVRLQGELGSGPVLITNVRNVSTSKSGTISIGAGSGTMLGGGFGK